MYDLVIRGGAVVDGTRAKPFEANLCVRDGLIAAITTAHAEGRDMLDASGQIVSPGFIDIHTHSAPYRLASPLAESKAFQGVTLEIGGNCGLSMIPALREEQSAQGSMEAPGDRPHDIAGLARRIQGNTIHLGMLIGHGALRGCVMGLSMRPPTGRELEEMKALLATLLDQGAMGLSLGLIYPPGSFCDFEELTALAAVVQAKNRLLAVHIRNENERVFEALDEALRLAELTGVRLQISHLKLMGISQWGKADALLEKIRAARAKGLFIHADQYPYDASSTSLSALLPNRAHDGGEDSMLARLRDKDQSVSILREADAEMARRGGPERVRIASTQGNYPGLEGLSLRDIAARWNVSPSDAILRLLLDCCGKVSCIYHSMHREDVLAIMREPFVAVGSDGNSLPLRPELVPDKPHRRSFGTFPMFLQTVREEHMMSIEDAVYKMTALPARALGLHDRGILKPGNAADITVFDYAAVRDLSSFALPVAKPRGIVHVVVDGVPVIRDGEMTPARNGRFLPHPDVLFPQA